MNYTKGGFPIWDDDFDKEFYTPEEIAESNCRVALIKGEVHARQRNKSVIRKSVAIEKGGFSDF